MNPTPRRSEQGVALLLTVIMLVALAALSFLIMTVVASGHRETRSSYETMRALYVAEGGVDMAVLDLNGGGDGNLGAVGAPVPFSYGAFITTVTPNTDGSLTVTSRGMAGGRVRIVEALVRAPTRVFDHAVFAGNATKDPTYNLVFEGLGVQADEVNGDVYSGGNIVVAQDATLNGAVRAKGAAVGVAAQTGVDQPIPDIPGMQYQTLNDVDVAAEFAAGATYRYDDAGGTAWQLPQSNPAHIFRLNPSDRGVETATTPKDDYFLEDPYETVRADYRQDGTRAYRISLDTGEGAQNIRRIYYIDGNLWIHNRRTYSFRFATPPQGVQVTFAVRGNIYISDNVFYDRSLDGVAFVAIKDENVADSGNVYFGDPVFGTLLTMDGFIYAENDFYDINLSASGSKQVTLNGTMSAGNHVAIQRTFGDQHSRLTVNFDDRLKEGLLDIPGVPASGATQLEYEVVFWLDHGDEVVN